MSVANPTRKKRRLGRIKNRVICIILTTMDSDLSSMCLLNWFALDLALWKKTYRIIMCDLFPLDIGYYQIRTIRLADSGQCQIVISYLPTYWLNILCCLNRLKRSHMVISTHRLFYTYYYFCSYQQQKHSFFLQCVYVYRGIHKDVFPIRYHYQEDKIIKIFSCLNNYFPAL